MPLRSRSCCRPNMMEPVRSMQAETPTAVDFVLVTFASGQLSNAYFAAKCTRTYAVASERFVLAIAAALYHGLEPSTGFEAVSGWTGFYSSVRTVAFIQTSLPESVTTTARTSTQTNLVQTKLLPSRWALRWAGPTRRRFPGRTVARTTARPHKRCGRGSAIPDCRRSSAHHRRTECSGGTGARPSRYSGLRVRQRRTDRRRVR